jgi:hypothetical protein
LPSGSHFIDPAESTIHRYSGNYNKKTILSVAKIQLSLQISRDRFEVKDNMDYSSNVLRNWTFKKQVICGFKNNNHTHLSNISFSNCSWIGFYLWQSTKEFLKFLGGLIFHRNLNGTLTKSHLIFECIYLTENPVLFKAQTIWSSQFVRIRPRHLCLISSSILVVSPTSLLLKVNIKKLELITFS